MFVSYDPKLALVRCE